MRHKKTTELQQVFGA